MLTIICYSTQQSELQVQISAIKHTINEMAMGNAKDLKAAGLKE
ncbi:MAG: hypothetical protein ACI8RD_007070 [Bacillariaceae sp.]|jgi:hypothetical protein